MRLGIFTALVLLLPLAVSAQSLGGLSESSSFSVSISPQYPAPYSQATLSFLSSAVDLTNATMKVSVAGKNIYQGSVRPVAVTLGKAGSIANVVVTITSGGANYTQTLSIQPQDIVLVAEPVSSSPPLYQGKPSVPLEGDVRVVAVANMRSAGGTISNSRTLSYLWTVDGMQIANSSGIGKESIMVASPLQYRSREVEVAISSPNGSLVGGTSLSLSAVEPSVQIYENDPLLGIRYENALAGGYAIKSSESTLFAAPFSLPTTSGAPFIQWLLNGDTAQTGSSITLRPTGNGQGSASLSLTASSGTFSNAMANLSLSFGAKQGFNLFGL